MPDLNEPAFPGGQTPLEAFNTLRTAREIVGRHMKKAFDEMQATHPEAEGSKAFIFALLDLGINFHTLLPEEATRSITSKLITEAYKPKGH